MIIPMYCSLQDKGLAKRILNHLRTKCNAPAGNVSGGSITVVDHSATDAQLALEQRIGLNLHVLRSLLMAPNREGMPLDLLLRVQKECDFDFLDMKAVEASFKGSLEHYLHYGKYTLADFKKTKITSYVETSEES